MGITVSATAAWAVLGAALRVARSGGRVDPKWEAFSWQTFGMMSKTYFPALGTALLARATDPRVDPLSIKATYGENTYSLRTLCHRVLVPAAQELGFSIRNTGREPMNNQPFFRYDHMLEIDRVLNPFEHKRFITGISPLAQLTQDEAKSALAAFLQVAVEAAEATTNYQLAPGLRSLRLVRRATRIFLSEGFEAPRRAQAFVAAAVEIGHEDVRTRRLNDPSRDLPGDVHAYVENLPILAAEVRTKPMPATEISAFAAACDRSGIARALAVVFASRQPYLPSTSERVFRRSEVLLTVISSPSALLDQALTWTDRPLQESIDHFVEAALQRLKDIEAAPETLDRWLTLTTPSEEKFE